jgi:hypothetical protein
LPLQKACKAPSVSLFIGVQHWTTVTETAPHLQTILASSSDTQSAQSGSSANFAPHAISTTPKTTSKSFQFRTTAAASASLPSKTKNQKYKFLSMVGLLSLK